MNHKRNYYGAYRVITAAPAAAEEASATAVASIGSEMSWPPCCWFPGRMVVEIWGSTVQGAWPDVMF